MQVAQRWNQSALGSTDGPDGLEQRVLCGDYLLEDADKIPIELRPRQSSAKLIDTFAFGNAYEVEELLLRMYEMGEEVSEFHIVEGDRDFQGAKKPYEFEAILNSGQFDAWKNKITYYKVEIPEGVKGYTLQEKQRQQMRSQMNDYKNYDLKDILLEGDLDEIVSEKKLKILKNCEPVTGSWSAHVHMGNFYFSLAWTDGDWMLPTTVGFFIEVPSTPPPPRLLESDANPSHDATLVHIPKSQSIWSKPNALSRRDGRLHAWHCAWTLNGPAGLAHKIFIRIAGIPWWAKNCCSDEATLAKFIGSGFYDKVSSYDPNIHPSKLSKEDLPPALLRHPEKFPNILRGVNW